MSRNPGTGSDALLIVDVQHGFVKDSTRGIPALVEKLQYEYEIVIATQFYNQEGSFFRTLIGWERLNADTPEFNLAFQLREDALRIIKSVYTCVDHRLLDYLSRKHVSSIDICGIDTDICVTKCAVDFFENGIEPVVLKNYCGSTAGEEAHEFALKILGRFIGHGQIR